MTKPIDIGAEIAKRQKFIRSKAEQVASLALERKSINEKVKAVFDDIDARGIDRKAFKDAIKLLRMEDEKREAYEKSRREIAAAFGWQDGTQIDMLAEDTKLPGVGAEDLEDLVESRDDPDEGDDGEDMEPLPAEADEAA